MSLELLDGKLNYGHYPPVVDQELEDTLREYELPDFLIERGLAEAGVSNTEAISNSCMRAVSAPSIAGGRFEAFAINPSCMIPPPPPSPEIGPISLPPPREGCTVTAWNCHFIKRKLSEDGNSIDRRYPPTINDGIAPRINFKVEDRYLRINHPRGWQRIDLLLFMYVDANDGISNNYLGPFRDTFCTYEADGYSYRTVFHFWVQEQHLRPETYYYYFYDVIYGWEYRKITSGKLSGFKDFCATDEPEYTIKRDFPPDFLECKCMCECSSPDNQRKRENDDAELKRMLRLILKRIGEPTEATLFDINTGQKGAQSKKIKFGSLFDAARINVWRTEVTNASLGIDTFPINAPSTTILPEKSGIFGKIFEHLKPEKRKTIDSLAELILWVEEQNNARDGQWHQSIAITDGGEVKDRIVLSDTASTLKEIFVLVHNLASSMTLLTDISMKALTEASAARTEASKAWIVSRDIQEWMDYPTKELTHNVPIGISPFKYSRSGPNDPEIVEPQEDIEMLLQPGEAKIKSDEWTGERSLNDVLVEVLQAVATIRAAFYQRS